MGAERETQPDNVVPFKRGARRAPQKPPAMPRPTGVQQIGDQSPLPPNLRESCLTDATIDAARLFVLDSSQWRQYGFKWGGRPQSGLLIPFLPPRAAEPYGWRLRPQPPVPAGRSGKHKKYDQPADTG